MAFSDRFEDKVVAEPTCVGSAMVIASFLTALIAPPVLAKSPAPKQLQSQRASDRSADLPQIVIRDGRAATPQVVSRTTFTNGVSREYFARPKTLEPRQAPAGTRLDQAAPTRFVH